MKSVQIQLTTKCEQRCYMCRQYTWESKSMSIEDLFNVLDKYCSNDKKCTITFTGGDPLSYDKLKELNEKIKEKGIIYQVFTNLYYKLNDEQKEFLLNAEIVQISFDGSNAEIYKNVRNPVNDVTYGRFISNIKWLKKNNVLVKLNCTLSRKNYFDFKNIFDFAFINWLNIRFFQVHTNENAFLEKQMYEYLMNSIDMIKKLQNRSKMIDDFVKEKTNIEKIKIGGMKPYKGKCFVKNEHLVVLADGTKYPCCRATNDNGEDWEGKYKIENLNDLDDPDILYEFCKYCDRYRKFNENWDNYMKLDKVYL